MRIELKGRISSDNAPQIEQEILRELTEPPADDVVFDASELEYISSAGLRVLLSARKKTPRMRIENVSPLIYDILETSGFTRMAEVLKQSRSIRTEGCRTVGGNADGALCSLDQDSMVRLYNGAEALSRIRRESVNAKLALALGIPAAVSCETVKTGDGYGAVFKLLNAGVFSAILGADPEKLDWCVDESVKVLRKIHSTAVPEGQLPDMKETAHSWAVFLQDCLPAEAGEKLLSLFETIPSDEHMIQGDYHPRNLVLQNDETLLIETSTLAVGHPVFDLASMYASLVGLYELNQEKSEAEQGFDSETARAFWRKSLETYLGTHCEHKLLEVERKARIIAYAHLLCRAIKDGRLDCEEGRKEIETWKQELLTLLAQTDALVFRTDELEIEAIGENTEEVQAFVEERLEAFDCSPKTMMRISVSVEEIFVNIANYAYQPNTGMAKIRAFVSGDPPCLTLVFSDRGIPYDPLAKDDPDVTLSAEDRNIGGLGIFMTKTFMDEESYSYDDGQNILTLKKIL